MTDLNSPLGRLVTLHQVKENGENDAFSTRWQPYSTTSPLSPVQRYTPRRRSTSSDATEDADSFSFIRSISTRKPLSLTKLKLSLTSLVKLGAVTYRTEELTSTLSHEDRPPSLSYRHDLFTGIPRRGCAGSLLLFSCFSTSR